MARGKQSPQPHAGEQVPAARGAFPQGNFGQRGHAHTPRKVTGSALTDLSWRKFNLGREGDMGHFTTISNK